MTVKCTFCKDTKIEPGIPGPCVWCEDFEPAMTGAVQRYTEHCGEGGGVAESINGQFVEFKDYEAALGREAALREELAALRESYEAMRDRKNSIVYLQQRLTVAEQRVGELKKLLCDVINEAPTGFAALKVDLAHRVNAALKPAEDPFGVLAETGMTYPEFMRSTFQERHKLTDAECEEFHVWKKNRGKPAAEGEGS